MAIFNEITQNQDQDQQHLGQEIISILIGEALPQFQELDLIKQTMVSKMLKDFIKDWATQGEEYKNEIKSAYEVFTKMSRAQQNIVLTLISQKIKKQIEESTKLDSKDFIQGLLTAFSDFQTNPIDIDPSWHLPQQFDDPPNQNGSFVPPWGGQNHTNDNKSFNSTKPEFNKTLIYANIEEQFQDLIDRNKTMYEIRQILQIFIDERVRPDDQQQFKDYLENIIFDYQDKQKQATDQSKLVSEQQEEQQYIIYISAFVVFAFIIFAIFLIRRQIRIKNMQRSYRDPMQIPEQSLD